MNECTHPQDSLQEIAAVVSDKGLAYDEACEVCRDCGMKFVAYFESPDILSFVDLRIMNSQIVSRTVNGK